MSPNGATEIFFSMGSTCSDLSHLFFAGEFQESRIAMHAAVCQIDISSEEESWVKMLRKMLLSVWNIELARS